MKQLTLIFFTLFMLVTCSMPLDAYSAEEDTKSVILYINPNQNPDPEDPDPEGQRATSRPFSCVISGSGVEVMGLDKSDFQSYNIISSEGHVISEFIDEFEFARAAMLSGAGTIIQINMNSSCLKGILTD